MLERHAASSQAFLPLAKAGAEWDEFTGTKGLDQVRGGGMIVVGCLNGAGKLSDDLEESRSSPSFELTVRPNCRQQA